MNLNEIECEYCGERATCEDPKKWFDFVDDFWAKHDSCMDFRYVYSIQMRKLKGGELNL